MSQPTVLVTGGCGYIGSHVARHLAEIDAKVIVIDNLSTGFRENLLNGETLVEANVGDQAALARIFTSHKIDAVIHFAAALVVPESVADPVKYYSNNTLNTLKLLESVVQHKVPRFIFSSTAATYGQPDKVPVKETDPTRPESPYGWSKLMSERMLQDIAAAHGLKYVILRYFNVAGADPEQRLGQRLRDATHLIKVACETAVGLRPSMSLFGTDYKTRDGTCIRDYIHVEDLASAHTMALDYLMRGGQSTLLNCGYGQGSTVSEVINAVKKVSGVDFKVTMAPRRPGDPAEVVASADEIKEVLGWRPRFANLDTIVEHAYKWERKLAGK
jgi:UDP-glucose 4-epimerase